MPRRKGEAGGGEAFSIQKQKLENIHATDLAIKQILLSQAELKVRGAGPSCPLRIADSAHTISNCLF